MKYKFSESNPGEDAILEMKDIAMLNTKINDWINDVSITEEDIKNDTTYQLRANIKLAFYNAQVSMTYYSLQLLTTIVDSLSTLHAMSHTETNLQFSNSQFSDMF